eukprot:14202945-Ditylum_brightwellii.AAC.1
MAPDVNGFASTEKTLSHERKRKMSSIAFQYVMKGTVVNWSMKHCMKYCMMNKVNLLNIWVHCQTQIKRYVL